MFLGAAFRPECELFTKQLYAVLLSIDRKAVKTLCLQLVQIFTKLFWTGNYRYDIVVAKILCVDQSLGVGICIIEYSNLFLAVWNRLFLLHENTKDTLKTNGKSNGRNIFI